MISRSNREFCGDENIQDLVLVVSWASVYIPPTGGANPRRQMFWLFHHSLIHKRPLHHPKNHLGLPHERL